MNADLNRIDYRGTGDAHHDSGTTPGLASLVTGPDRVGCGTMVIVVVVASGLALGIVTTLAWVLA